MAEVTGFVRDWQSSKLGVERAITKVTFTDGQVAAGALQGILHSPGIIPVGTAAVAGSTIARFAKGNASDIGGYRKLDTAPGTGTLFARTAIAGVDDRTIIEEYATDAGDMDGVAVNVISPFSWAVSAKRSAGANDVVIDMEFLHRTAGGAETIIGTDETANLTDAYVTYTGTTNISQSFDTNERLVVKYYIRNDGEPV